MRIDGRFTSLGSANRPVHGSNARQGGPETAQRGGRVFTVNPVQRKHRDFSGVANLSPTTLAASARSPILAAQLIDGHPVFQRHPPRPEETAP